MKTTLLRLCCCILIAALLAAFAGCGTTAAPNETTASAAESTAAEQTAEAAEAASETTAEAESVTDEEEEGSRPDVTTAAKNLTDKTREYKADLNHDGEDETLRFILGKNANGTFGAFVIEYYDADGEKLDTFDLDRVYLSYDDPTLPERNEENDLVFGDSFAQAERSELRSLRQNIRVYVNNAGNIAVNYYHGIDGNACEYLMLVIENDTFFVSEHLIDPGYTSGVGLYEARTYFTEGECLFEIGDGKYNGKPVADDFDYDSVAIGEEYLGALNKVMGPYGYIYDNRRYTKNGGDVRGYVTEGNGVKNVFNESFYG